MRLPRGLQISVAGVLEHIWLDIRACCGFSAAGGGAGVQIFVLHSIISGAGVVSARFIKIVKLGKKGCWQMGILTPWTVEWKS
jgi:hypothetical protein